MNRAEKARAIVMCEEIAAALRAELLGEAATEHNEGSTPTWRMDDVTVSASVSKPSIVVSDHAAFLAWVERIAPTEIETVTTTQVRDAYKRRILAEALANAEDLCDAEGNRIDGIRFEPGGALRSVSVRPSADFKDRAALAAAAVAAGQHQLTLPSLLGGAADVIDATPVTVVTPAAESVVAFEDWATPVPAAPAAPAFDDPWADLPDAWSVAQ